MEIAADIMEDQNIYIKQLGMYARIKKKRSWFGGVMSIERSSGFLTVTKDSKILYLEIRLIIIILVVVVVVVVVIGMCTANDYEDYTQ